jgi:hypothetical protein
MTKMYIVKTADSTYSPAVGSFNDARGIILGAWKTHL